MLRRDVITDSGLRVRCAVADGIDINEVPVQNGQIVISSQVSALLYDIMGQHMSNVWTKIALLPQGCLYTDIKNILEGVIVIR